MNHTQRRYSRITKRVKMSTYLVGFIDILGFKNLLDNEKFTFIQSLFEEWADFIFELTYQSVNFGYYEISPKISNFSDSIIIYSKLFALNDIQSQYNSYIFYLFHTYISTIIAVGLKWGIPIRGGVAIDEFYVTTACSNVDIFIKSDNFRSFDIDKNKHGSISTSNPIFKDGRIGIPIHFGRALVRAYQTELSVKVPGVYIEKNDLSHRYLGVTSKEFQSVKNQIAEGYLLEFKINEKHYYGFNWCKRLYKDELDQSHQLIVNNIHKYQEKNNQKLLSKWQFLLKYFL